MEKKERSGPLVVDAEYKVVGDARRRGVALENVNVHPIVKGGFKLAVRGVFWVVK